MVTDTKESNKLLHCSFCGKNQNEVNKLIAGPSVFVCDECVDLCNEIIRDELEEKSIKMVTNMISSVRKNLFFKNRNSCTFCEYYNTEHCT